MSLIREKLLIAGITEANIELLEKKFWTKLVDQIQQFWLKSVGEKAWADTSHFPEIDFTHLMELGQDIIGTKDSDGDGKTGLAEVADTLWTITEKVSLKSLKELKDSTFVKKMELHQEQFSEKWSDFLGNKKPKHSFVS